MELRHVMIDLETLDLKPSTKIISIGAVIFCPKQGKISKDTFYMELNFREQTERTKDPETVKWWKAQSPEARESFKGTTSLEDALEELAFWLPTNCKVWGNGSIFDIAILEDAYRQLEMDIPWKFWNVLDQRTIKYLYESTIGGWSKTMGGVKHNALDDAKHQAISVIEMYKKITNHTVVEVMPLNFDDDIPF